MDDESSEEDDDEDEDNNDHDIVDLGDDRHLRGLKSVNKIVSLIRNSEGQGAAGFGIGGVGDRLLQPPLYQRGFGRGAGFGQGLPKEEMKAPSGLQRKDS